MVRAGLAFEVSEATGCVGVLSGAVALFASTPVFEGSEDRMVTAIAPMTRIEAIMLTTAGV